MRSFVVTMVLLCGFITAWAQKLEVSACYNDVTDSTAVLSPIEDIYQHGKYCALLKVQLEAEDAVFEDTGVVRDAERKGSEYWVYMCDGSRKITIKVPGYLPKQVLFSDYGVDKLQQFKVYRLLTGIRNIVINECVLDDMNIFASTFKGRREDPSNPGKYCALVKVFLAASSATFAGDTVGKIDYRLSEYRVYMQAGSSELTVNLPGYAPCKIDFKNYPDIISLEAEKVYKVELSLPENGSVYQELLVTVFPKDAYLSIDEERVPLVDGFFSKMLPEGKHSYRAERTGYQAVERVVNLLGPQDTLRISLLKNTSDTIYRQTKAIDMSFYLGANYQIGSLSGIGASVGTYISNFNVQLDVLMGLTASEPIYWNGLSTDPYSYTYKPLYLGAKLGYGIKVGESFRFTPQVGIGVSKITGTVDHKGQGSDPEVKAMSVVPLSVGLRAEWLIAKHFGICVAPEYDIAMQKGKPYEAVSAVSSDVKGFGEGFNLKAGLFLIF